MKTALIAGASGLVGNRLMYCLLKDPAYSKVIVLLRKELAIKDPKLVQLIVNYEQLDKYKDQLVADDVFCCLGTTIKKAGSQPAFLKVDFTYPLSLAKITSDQASQFFIITAVGADKNSKIFYSRTKGEIEGSLSSIALKKLFLIRPSMLMGNRKELRIGEEIGKALSGFVSFFLLGSLKKYRPIHDIEVARAMQALAHANYKEGIHTIESDQLKELGADKSGVKKSIYEEVR